jgi:hypothetical protein
MDSSTVFGTNQTQKFGVWSLCINEYSEMCSSESSHIFMIYQTCTAGVRGRGKLVCGSAAAGVPGEGTPQENKG